MEEVDPLILEMLSSPPELPPPREVEFGHRVVEQQKVEEEKEEVKIEEEKVEADANSSRGGNNEAGDDASTSGDGLFRSMAVDETSKTPYSDATQVRTILLRTIQLYGPCLN